MFPIQRNRRLYMLRREYKVYLNLLDYLHNSYHLVSNRDMLFKLPLSKRAVAPYISVRRLNIDFTNFRQDFKVISRSRDLKSIFL